ncbi:MAG: amidohydrolase family protein, partial [Pseudomonadales bacterium]
TGMRFTKETWHEYQEKHPKGSVIHHYVDEAWTHEVIAADDVIIITDGLPAISEKIGVPPQGIGSFSRILGRYARDKQALSLMSALKKMTLMPAQRLEKIAPVFTRKGRLQVGADADITVFDAETIIDNTTYRKPYQASTGVKYVLVNGELIVEDGRFIPDSLPGKLISSLNK